MIVERITFRRTYNLGNYNSEAIGVDYLLNEGESIQDAINEARKQADINHKAINAHLYAEMPVEQPIIVETKEDKPVLSELEQMLHDIGTCTDLKVLDIYKFLSRKYPEATTAYRKKLIELNNK